MKWQRKEPTKTDKIGWRTIVTKTFALPDGRVDEFQTFNEEGSHNAGVIALTPDNKVITVNQYRPAQEMMMKEIPGGGVEKQETDFQVAALRELKEETGYVSDKVTSLGHVYKDAYNNSTWHYFLAEDCVLHEDGTAHEANEFIEVVEITIDELIENAKNGRMTDVSAVFLAYDKLNELRGR